MTYRDVPTDQLREPEWSWHFDDELIAHKLDGSLAQHGQLRAIVVRQREDGLLEIVEGRSLYRACVRAGRSAVTVADLGLLSQADAVLAALSLELRQETDYVRLAREVSALVQTQGPAFSAVVPFTGVDIDYYVKLSAGFDWSQFHEEDRQEGLFGEELAESQAAEAEMSLIEDAQAPQGAPEPTTPTPPPAPVSRPQAPRSQPGTPITGPSALDFARGPQGDPTPQVVPADLDPVQAFALDLKRRGHHLLTREGKFFISSASRLTEEDRVLVKTHREALLAMATPWAAEGAPSTSLASFLGTAPPVTTWVADTPPCLDGITDVILNFATNGLDWAHGARPVGVTVSTLDGQLTRFLPFAFQGGGNLDEGVVREWARRELRGKHILNANARFDLHHSREWGVDLEAQGNTFSDIQHTAALLDDTRRKFAIDVLATDYLPGNVEVARVDERDHSGRFYQHHASEVAEREVYTAQLVGRLRAVMYPELDKQDLRRVQDLEDAVIPCVVEMEKNAAPIDRDLLKLWCQETKRAQEQALYMVAKEVGFSVNPDASGDWVRLFEHFHIPITQFTESGSPSFTDAVLKGIDNPFVQMTRKAGKLASLRAKFLDAYDQVIGDDDLLRYHLHQLRGDEYGTVRGRFSASDKNIQQVMNHTTHMESFGSLDFFVRRLFIAGRETRAAGGMVLSADAKQIEYRIFASHTGSPKLLEAYALNPKLSYHELVWDLVKPFKPDIPYVKAKSLNFMKIYGGGKDRTAAVLELPRAESDQFVAIYDNMFPEVLVLLRKASHLAETRGYVKTVLGRRARFPDKKFAHKALNAVIQGSAADIMKQKLVEIHRERKETGFTLRYTVHDEVVGDVPDQESAQKVEDILNRQSFAQLKVPILWAVSTGQTWADCK